MRPVAPGVARPVVLGVRGESVGMEGCARNRV